MLEAMTPIFRRLIDIFVKFHPNSLHQIFYAVSIKFELLVLHLKGKVAFLFFIVEAVWDINGLHTNQNE